MAAWVALAVVITAAKMAGATVLTTAAEVEVEQAATTHALSTGRAMVSPYPKLAPIPMVVLRGGYGKHHKRARDGVRGFEGSGVRGSIPGPHPDKGSSVLRVW